METSNYCSAIQYSERSVNAKRSYQDVRSLLNLIKILKGRELFLKLKSLADTIPLEAAEEVLPGEIVNYLEGIQKLLSHLLMQHVMLNETHGEMLYEFSEKFPITKNISHPMLEHKKKILDYSLKINEEIQREKDFISQVIESNKRWCSLEKEFNESLNIHQHHSQNTNSSCSREQAKLQAKKMKKLRLIKVGYEIIWGIMSIHNIDYSKEEEFRNILYRINKAQNVSILSISEIYS